MILKKVFWLKCDNATWIYFYVKCYVLKTIWPWAEVGSTYSNYFCNSEEKVKIVGFSSFFIGKYYFYCVFTGFSSNSRDLSTKSNSFGCFCDNLYFFCIFVSKLIFGPSSTSIRSKYWIEKDSHCLFSSWILKLRST